MGGGGKMILKDNDITGWKFWQAFLNSVGFALYVDGKPGPLTIGATKKFQEANALKADGIVGDDTIAAAKAKGFGGFTVVATRPEASSVKSSGKSVLVSAGHTNKDGQDQGAAGNGYVEGKEAVAIRDHVAALLRQDGVNVIEDGADGASEPLKKAITLARTVPVAVEFHFNAGPPKATGIEVLSKPNKKQLAQELALAINEALGLPLRGGELGWKSDSSGQHHRLGFCQAGGLIVEVCFISNASDMAAYKNGFEQMVSNLAEVLANA